MVPRASRRITQTTNGLLSGAADGNDVPLNQRGDRFARQRNYPGAAARRPPHGLSAPSRPASVGCRYTLATMRLDFAGRNVVCLSAMPPTAFDFEAFERATGLARPATQVVNAQLALVEYGRVQVVIPPDGRLQFNTQPNASRDLVRRGAGEVLRQASAYAPTGVGFNGLVRVELTEDESDPLKALLDESLIVERLGVQVTRRGLKLVYPLEEARMTIDVIPDEDDVQGSTLQINRHYSSVPGDGALDQAISWFAALNDELTGLARRLLAPVVGGQNAA